MIIVNSINNEDMFLNFGFKYSEYEDSYIHIVRRVFEFKIRNKSGIEFKLVIPTNGYIAGYVSIRDNVCKNSSSYKEFLNIGKFLKKLSYTMPDISQELKNFILSIINKNYINVKLADEDFI